MVEAAEVEPASEQIIHKDNSNLNSRWTTIEQHIAAMGRVGQSVSEAI